MKIESEILRYYEQGREDSRSTAAPSLELIRTQVLLRRFLPAAPARVLDVDPEPERFTTAYFHTYEELTAEVTESGLAGSVVLPVEGPPPAGAGPHLWRWGGRYE